MGNEVQAVVEVSLEALLRKRRPLAGERVYRVTVKNKATRYVISNSQGNAAQAVCEVETVKQSEVTKAAFAVLNAQTQAFTDQVKENPNPSDETLTDQVKENQTLEKPASKPKKNEPEKLPA